MGKFKCGKHPQPFSFFPIDRRHFKIMEDEDFLAAHYGQHPVLFIDCSGIMGKTEKIEYAFGRKIVDLFSENAFLWEMLDEQKKGPSAAVKQKIIDIELRKFEDFFQKVERTHWETGKLVNICKNDFDSSSSPSLFSSQPALQIASPKVGPKSCCDHR
jgi:hypothetical protein